MRPPDHSPSAAQAPGNDKPIHWCGASREAVRAFPAHARKHLGRELRRVQGGATPKDWKPMSSIGPGVIEVRVHAEGEFRAFVIAKFEESIYVLHAFHKKDRRTPQRDVDVARARYHLLLLNRRRQ